MNWTEYFSDRESRILKNYHGAINKLREEESQVRSLLQTEPWVLKLDLHVNHVTVYSLMSTELYDIGFSTTWDVAVMTDVKEKAAEHDFKVEISQEPKSTYRVMRLKKKYEEGLQGTIRLYFDASIEGSVCELVVIGEERHTYTTTIKVYDIVCPEGAKEASEPNLPKGGVI